MERKRCKIIRSARFSKENDPENFHREQLMLYIPWRKKTEDLIQNFATYTERCQQLEFEITRKRQHYEHHTELSDKALKDLEDENLCHYSDVAANTRHLEEQDKSASVKASDLYSCFDPGANKLHSQYDLVDDSGVFPRTNDDDDLVTKYMDTEKYRALVRSLNGEQMEFFYHVLHSVKTSDQSLRVFLSGGAGVGKSTVTNALFEAVTRYLNSAPGENPDEIKVLKLAATGKAAFNMSGNTIHSALKVPADKGFQYYPLNTDRLNTIRSQLRKVKIAFIDEISMVGSGF